MAPEQFAALKDAGVKHVINLRPRAEQGEFDEAETAASCGMAYANLPIAGPHELTLANVKAFDKLLAETGGGNTVVHCASNNRVGALFALRVLPGCRAPTLTMHWRSAAPTACWRWSRRLPRCSTKARPDLIQLRPGCRKHR